jgi:hypothetical protein
MPVRRQTVVRWTPKSFAAWFWVRRSAGSAGGVAVDAPELLPSADRRASSSSGDRLGSRLRTDVRMACVDGLMPKFWVMAGRRPFHFAWLPHRPEIKGPTGGREQFQPAGKRRHPLCGNGDLEGEHGNRWDRGPILGNARDTRPFPGTGSRHPGGPG